MMKKREHIRNEMERRLFKTGLSISIITVSILFIIDVSYLADYDSAIIEAIGAILFGILFYYSSKELYSSKLIFPYLLVIMALLNLGWFTGGGFNVAITLLFFVGISVSLIMVPERLRKLFVAFFLVDLFGLMALEYLNPELRLFHEDKTEELMIVYIFILITYSLSIYLIVFMKDNYEKVRELIGLQNTTLNIQSADLMEINNKLESANDLLEKKIMERTLRIEEQKKKILDYAFMNSHHVRAPLVNILGLTSLYESQELSEEEESYVFEKLKSAADQLNLEFEMVKGHIEKEEWEQKI